MNQYWRSRVIPGQDHPRVYMSPEGKDFKREVTDLIYFDYSAHHLSDKPITVWIVVCFRDKRKQDLDNRLKPLLDALSWDEAESLKKNGVSGAGVWRDDSQIVSLSVHQGPVVEGGAVFVSAWETPSYDPARAIASFVG